MFSARIPLAALAAGLSLSLAACGSTTKTDTTTTATDTAMATDAGAAMTPAAADSHAAQFLTDAMKGDNSEVRVGNLAADMGSSQGVKDYGKMLASDHGAHKDKLAALAGSMNVPVTNDTKTEADELYKKLQGMSGKDFDKAFVAGMVEDHKKDIAAYQDEAKSSDPAPVIDLAKQTLPTLQKHLDTAEKLQKGI